MSFCSRYYSLIKREISSSCSLKPLTLDRFEISKSFAVIYCWSPSIAQIFLTASVEGPSSSTYSTLTASSLVMVLLERAGDLARALDFVSASSSSACYLSCTFLTVSVSCPPFECIDELPFCGSITDPFWLSRELCSYYCVVGLLKTYCWLSASST